MESGAVAAAYAAETVAEGTVGAAVTVAQPTLPIHARWHRIAADTPVPRSSHTLSVVKGRAYIFGGETGHRVLADNAMHVVTLPLSGSDSSDYREVPAVSPDHPAPRIGHTAAVVGNHIYIYGGRGGSEKGLLEEQGRVWVFDTTTDKWSYLDPAEGSPNPGPRYYHACTASEHPLPAAMNAGADAAASATVLDEYGTLLLHGGWTSKDSQADVWSFDVAARFWAKLPDAPGPARGGAALAIARDRLYRFGGFDGTSELGGGIDYLALSKATFDGKAGKGEMALTLQSGKWETVDVAEGAAGPGHRSVGGMHAATTGQGRNYLVLLLGERSPKSEGSHEAAGTFCSDVWAYQLRPDGMSGASFKDAARMLVGAKQREGTWGQVGIPEATMAEGKAEAPGPRGWFASATAGDVDPGSVVVWGGLNEANERLGDGWMLTFGDE